MDIDTININVDLGTPSDLVGVTPTPAGPQGEPGKDGITPTIGDNGNWYIGDTDTGKPSRGEPANLDGKVISIMGDSISTYLDWIPNSRGIENDGLNLRHTVYYPTQGTYLSNVNMTWWHQLIFKEFNAKLGVNESWSGSFIGNNKDTNTATFSNSTVNDTGPDTCMAGITRIINLGSNGTPDIIYFYGGTNDIAQPGTPGESLGNFDNTVDYSTVDLTTKKWSTFVDAFRTAIMRMQYFYPKAKIIVLLPTYCNTYYNRATLELWLEQMKEICDYFGVNYIDLRACGITWSNINITLGDGNIHPNEYGHKLVAEYVKNKTLAIIENDEIENVVYTVTNNLTTLSNENRYIKGISKDNSYSATLTGLDLTVGRVSMNGIDITTTVYNNATGLISIPNVTGDIVISEGEPITISVSSISLNASTKSMMVNDNETLTATILPLNATNKNVTWTTNNQNVSLTPNGLTCLITGVNNGNSIVTVTTEDGNYTASCEFTIQEIELVSIQVTTPPSTIAYKYGETFSKNGMVVTATYNDNTTEILEDNDYSISPSGTLTDSDTSITISYTYNGITKTTTQNITVATLSNISITTQPNKTNYYEGELFDATGMVVTATWSDNTTSTVTNYTYSPNTQLTSNDTTIIISYTIGGITKTTTQSITFEPDTVWYSNVYQVSGWTNPNSYSVTNAGDFAYNGGDVKALFQGHTINIVRLVPATAGIITVRVYNDANDIIGRTDTASLRDGQTATITITQEMVSRGGYQEIPLSNNLVIGANQFWSIQTAGDTGKFKFALSAGWSISRGYEMYNNLGTTNAVIVFSNAGLCVDMGYKRN